MYIYTYTKTENWLGMEKKTWHKKRGIKKLGIKKTWHKKNLA